MRDMEFIRSKKKLSWNEHTLFLGFLFEVCLFITVGILFIPMLLIALLLLPFALIWAIVVGIGIKKYVIREFKRETDFIKEVSDGIN